MKRQTIIVIITPGKEPEAWGNLKKLCEAKGFDILPYHSLKSSGGLVLRLLSEYNRRYFRRITN